MQTQHKSAHFYQYVVSPPIQGPLTPPQNQTPCRQPPVPQLHMCSVLCRKYRSPVLPLSTSKHVPEASGFLRNTQGTGVSNMLSSLLDEGRRAQGSLCPQGLSGTIQGSLRSQARVPFPPCSCNRGSHPVFHGFVGDPSIHVRVHDSGAMQICTLCFPGTGPTPSARLVLSIHSDVNFFDVGHTGLNLHTGLLYSSPPCYSTFSFTVFICRPGSQHAPNSGIKWMDLLAIR